MVAFLTNTMSFFSKRNPFCFTSSLSGLVLSWRKPLDWERAQQELGDELNRIGHRLMTGLLETGRASLIGDKGDILLPPSEAVCLDEECREIFELPPPWPGGFRLQTNLAPNMHGFAAALRLFDERGVLVSSWTLEGPLLCVDGAERYLPTEAQFAALRSFMEWRETDNKAEIEHLILLKSLRDAADHGCRLDLLAVAGIEIHEADECILEVTEMPDGSFELTPVPVGGFITKFGMEHAGSDAASEQESAENYSKLVHERLHHLSGNSPRAVLRIGQALILLDDNQTSQARTAVKHRRVPPEEREKFNQSPRQWLADNIFFDREIEFLPRVIGIGEWKSRYLGSSGELGEKVDWFDQKPEPEKKPKEQDEDPPRAPGNGVDEADDDFLQKGPLVPLISDNDLELSWGRQDTCLSHGRNNGYPFDFSKHPREPFPHPFGAAPAMGGRGIILGFGGSIGRRHGPRQDLVSAVIFGGMVPGMARRERDRTPSLSRGRPVVTAGKLEE